MNLLSFSFLKTDENTLRSAVACIGPILVGIYVPFSDDSFYYYSEGIYEHPECNNFSNVRALNHASELKFLK